MEKTPDESFRDWEATAFGFGYGSGEPHVIPALKTFVAAIPEREYDYQKLEEAVGPVAAWMFINTFCRGNHIDYGSSTRFGWLTPSGIALKEYVDSKTADELLEAIFRDGPEDATICYPDACNCGPAGYEKGRVCKNPFWERR